MVSQGDLRSSSTTIQAYDAIAPMYESYSETRSTYLETIERLVSERIAAGERLLDVGAGDGRRTRRIVETTQIEDFVAIEPSGEMAKICRENLRDNVHEVLAEQLDTLDIGYFDVALALWNVLGHVNSSSARLSALKGISKKLKTGGRLILDVNNRHNAPAYGFWTVAKRVFIDAIWFDDRRGDATYDWNIGGNVFKSSGHLFIEREVVQLAAKAGLSVSEKFCVDYSNGACSKSFYKGQMFFVFIKK